MNKEDGRLLDHSISDVNSATGESSGSLVANKITLIDDGNGTLLPHAVNEQGELVPVPAYFLNKCKPS